MITAAEQPVRYGAAKIAKSKALVMMVERNDADGNPSGQWAVACFGNKAHYHPDIGICCHVETLAASISMDLRAVTQYLPWGEMDQREREMAA